MDRHDLETIGAMLATSFAIGLNMVFLQADAVAGGYLGQWVLVPVFVGLAVSLSGVVAHVRRKGRDMVIVDRIWAGSLTYLALSGAVSAVLQPRFE